MNIFDIDRMALEAARTPRYEIVAKAVANIAGAIAPIATFIPGVGPEVAAGLGLLGSLGGGGGQTDANTVGGYYDNALGKLVNATGSPAAKTFGAEEAASLQPLFDQQTQNLKAKEAAMGITNSGAAKADFSDLSRGQSATLAGAIAPLYQTAIGQYGAIAGQGAGAQTGAYQFGQNNYLNALNGIGSFAGSLQQPNSNPYATTTPPYAPVAPNGYAADPNAPDQTFTVPETPAYVPTTVNYSAG